MATVLERFNEREEEANKRYKETMEFVPSWKRDYECEAVCSEHHTTCQVSGSMGMQGLAHREGKHACVTHRVNHFYNDYEFDQERHEHDQKLAHKYLFGDKYTKEAQ